MLPCTPANGPKQTVHLLRLHPAWSTSRNHFDVISALLRSDCRLCEPPRLLSLGSAGEPDGQSTASQLPDQRSQPAKAEVEDVPPELVTLTSSQSDISGSEADRGIRLLLMSALLLLVSVAAWLSSAHPRAERQTVYPFRLPVNSMLASSATRWHRCRGRCRKT